MFIQWLNSTVTDRRVKVFEIVFACSGLICYINKISLNYSAHSIYNVKPLSHIKPCLMLRPSPTLQPQGSSMSNNAATACHVPAEK